MTELERVVLETLLTLLAKERMRLREGDGKSFAQVLNEHQAEIRALLAEQDAPGEQQAGEHFTEHYGELVLHREHFTTLTAQCVHDKIKAERDTLQAELDTFVKANTEIGVMLQASEEKLSELLRLVGEYNELWDAFSHSHNREVDKSLKGGMRESRGRLFAYANSIQGGEQDG